jgi:hypothetical protein
MTYERLFKAREASRKLPVYLDRLIDELSEDGARQTDMAEALGWHKQLVYEAKKRAEHSQ